ncbi:Bcr/CflA family efflux MFS transporter [Sphingobacterium sp. IITKGP-BTPF85]|uniref:Bcr/CflA family efflux MFS transporter n=1 Tax=Sphingobacterium sp. IITKGP-BTPF85 TaxID=1338009 RepID=UPI0003FF42FB|nr:Bcr/CflA family efflux MFS transporter [Sphingobacterium sp. IITKGP-BTPF85]
MFTLASLCIFFTNDVLSLLVLRLLQAIGVCAAAVSWQALVVEYYPASQTNKIFATIMPMVALSPALAPLLGVYLLQHFGWRSIFITLAGIAVLLILYTLTLMRKHKSDALDDTKAVEKTEQSYFSLLKSKAYVGNVLLYAFCSGSFFAWLTGSPFFLKELGYDESQIGLSFVPQTIAFMMGGYGYRALANRIETKKLMPVLLILYSVSLLAIYAMSVMTTPTLTLLLIPFCGMALANGACYPIVVAQALRVFPNNLGKAAGLQNAIQLGICFIASAIVSVFSKDALLATAIVMVGTIPFMLIAYRLTLKGK